METVRQIQQIYCSRAMTVAIVIGFICIAAGWRPIGKGLILGALFSVLNFVLMGIAIPYQLGKGRNKTFLISLASLLFRYTALALPVLIAIKYKQFNMFSTIAGLFLVQMLILVEQAKAMIITRSGKQG